MKKRIQAPLESSSLGQFSKNCAVPEGAPIDCLDRFSLIKIEPQENCYRYIDMFISRDLFGVIAVRRWGRLGKTENIETRTFDDERAAITFLNVYYRKKIKIGYSHYSGKSGKMSRIFLKAGQKQKVSTASLSSADVYSLEDIRQGDLFGKELKPVNRRAIFGRRL